MCMMSEQEHCGSGLRHKWHHFSGAGGLQSCCMITTTSSTTVVAGLPALGNTVDIQSSMGHFSWITQCAVWENIQSFLGDHELSCCSIVRVMGVSDHLIINPDNAFSVGFVWSHVHMKANRNCKQKMYFEKRLFFVWDKMWAYNYQTILTR